MPTSWTVHWTAGLGVDVMVAKAAAATADDDDVNDDAVFAICVPERAWFSAASVLKHSNLLISISSVPPRAGSPTMWNSSITTNLRPASDAAALKALLTGRRCCSVGGADPRLPCRAWSMQQLTICGQFGVNNVIQRHRSASKLTQPAANKQGRKACAYTHTRALARAHERTLLAFSKVQMPILARQRVQRSADNRERSRTPMRSRRLTQ